MTFRYIPWLSRSGILDYKIPRLCRFSRTHMNPSNSPDRQLYRWILWRIPAGCSGSRRYLRSSAWSPSHSPSTCEEAQKRKEKKESLFYLTTPLKHIDFHIIGYWMSNVCSFWHISFRGNLLSLHRLRIPISKKGSFICTFPQTGQHIQQPLMDQLCTTAYGT